jgi:predicted dehydrogenase
MPSPTAVHRPVVVAVVGLGYWGPNLLRILADDVDVDVRWLCDQKPDRLARFGRRHPGARLTSSLDTLLGDPDVDAVIVATPVGTHFSLASACLAAGKHTFVEKPLAPSSVLADELIALAQRVDRVLMCGHTFLYSPPVRAVRRMLDEQVLGDLYFLSSSRVNLGPYRNDVSVVWDLGPHDFSILLYWLGKPPLRLRATGRDALASGIADIAFVSMTFPGGVVASVELSWLAPSKLRRTVVVGSKKMVVYEDGSAEPIRLFDRGIVLGPTESFGEHHLSYRTGDVISPNLETCEPLMAELAEFTSAVRRGDPLSWEAELARNVVRMTEAAERSLKAGGVAVALDAPVEQEDDGPATLHAAPSPLGPEAPAPLAIEEPAA